MSIRGEEGEMMKFFEHSGGSLAGELDIQIPWNMNKKGGKHMEERIIL
jgi:hypothetical protein